MKTILLPSLGADMTEGTLVKWIKNEGDKLARGDKIAEIETDKTIVELESHYDGYLRKLAIEEGVTAPVGTVIAYVGEQDEPLPEAPESPPTANSAAPAEAPQASVKEAQPVAVAPAPESPPAVAVAQPSADAEGADGAIKASPMARSLARKLNVKLDQVSGSGPGGRVTKDDVLNFKPNLVKPGFGGLRSVRQAPKLEAKTAPLSSMRRAIAKTTVKSNAEIPAFQVSISVDMTAAMEWRAEVNDLVKESGSKISVNDIVLKAIVAALTEHPKWNATYADDSLRFNADVNIGVAIALEAGLIVPAIIGAQNMDIVELSDAAKDLGKRARANRLTEAELTRGTFSTSNLGMFNVDTFTAIIVPGQSGILSVGSARQAAVVRGDKIEPRPIMQAVLSADHRVGDGAEAGQLLAAFREHIEKPAKLFL